VPPSREVLLTTVCLMTVRGVSLAQVSWIHLARRKQCWSVSILGAQGSACATLPWFSVLWIRLVHEGLPCGRSRLLSTHRFASKTLIRHACLPPADRWAQKPDWSLPGRYQRQPPKGRLRRSPALGHRISQGRSLPMGLGSAQRGVPAMTGVARQAPVRCSSPTYRTESTCTWFKLGHRFLSSCPFWLCFADRMHTRYSFAAL
jgi:hypothetical protein